MKGNMALLRNLPLYCKCREKALKVSHSFGTVGMKCLSTTAQEGNKSVEVVATLLDDKHMTLSTGKLAKLADGCVSVSFKNTTVMATVVSKEKKESSSFIPLTVNYQQKAAALGRIPLNFFRREIGVTEHEILTSRVIDRSLRPLFPPGFAWNTQIICNPLAIDGSNFPDVLAINAASAALAVSDVPWNGPVGAVRVGLIGDEGVVNPTKQDLAKSKINLVVTARKSNYVTMLEGTGKDVSESELFKCIEIGVQECQKIVKAIEELREMAGKEKRTFEQDPIDPELQSAVESLCAEKLRSIFQNHNHNKLSRDEAVSRVQDEVLKELESEHGDNTGDVRNIFTGVCKNVFRELIFETGIRCDGRKLTELRKINCEVNLFDPLHGSSLFQRGQTQVMCTVALDSPNSALRVDKISMLSSGLKEKNFFVHYEFPPFATKETKMMGPVGRREIGHGILAEKALQSNIPENFPFTIRLTSEVLESNGSSSMATVCGGSLALMDAGVPVRNPCAGVAMGFLSKCDENGELVDYRILTDLLGIEDYFGEMDFKIAGTKTSCTALQLDVKNQGVTVAVLFEILKKASEAISEILNIMHETCPKVRVEKKKNWPETEIVKIPVHLRSLFVGPGGLNLKKLEAETGVEVTELSIGEFSVFAPNSEAMSEAREVISEILKSTEAVTLEFGAVYKAQITEIKESGCMVSLHPSLKPAYIHISQLDMRQVRHPSALGLEEGQEITVKYFGRDPVSGAVRLSRKALQAPASEVVRTLQKRS